MQGPVFTDVPVLCGHRGAGRGVVGGHAENTWASVQAAVDAGLDWVEIDARLTADDALVASHEPVTADGRAISELTEDEAEERGMLRIDTLLRELPDRVAVNVDVKTAVEDALRPRGDTTAARTAQLVESSGTRRRLLLTSADPAALEIVGERLPGVPRGLVTWTRYPLRKGVPAAVHLGLQVVAAHVAAFGMRELAGTRVEQEAPRAVEVAHQAGIQVAAWCPQRHETDRLVEMGVDCLIVDDAVMAPEDLEAAEQATGADRR